MSAPPGVPIESFTKLTQFDEGTWAEFQEALAQGKYTIGVDRTRAHVITDQVATRPQVAWLMFLVYVPIITAIALVVASILTREYLLLVGIPLVVVSHFLGYFLVARPGSGGAVFFVLGALVVHGWIDGLIVEIGLAATVLLQLLSRKLWYTSNGRIALRWINRSEQIFLAAFQMGVTMVKDETNGVILRPADSEART